MSVIREISIQNFRSFTEKKYTKNLKNLSSQVIFTGENNVGKTNILRAIYLFFNPHTYDRKKDQSEIKRITGGGTQHPSIELKLEELDSENKHIVIKCDLNKVGTKEIYSSKNFGYETEKSIKRILGTYKCVFISTTDVDIEKQAEDATNDMLIKFYKKRSREIKKSIEDFEESYKNMTEIFEENIKSIEGGLAEGFSILENQNDRSIKPKFKVNQKLTVDAFLKENISFQIDDTYSQSIGNKGAGVQRTSLILLNFFLLDHVFTNNKKIILLDEPESFLYPLLEKRIVEFIGKKTCGTDNSQVFITTHSREFLRNSKDHDKSFFNIKTECETKKLARSVNEKDISKYSLVEAYNIDIRNKVLRNYGLLNEVDDYDEIIIVEGPTDKKYLEEILKNEKRVPQIRLGNDYGYNFIGKGASAMLVHLAYLDKISKVDRKIFILLDGDMAGQESLATLEKKIRRERLENITSKNIKIKILDTGKEIEDYVYTQDLLIRRIKEMNPEIFTKSEEDMNSRASAYLANNNKKSIMDHIEACLSSEGSKKTVLGIKHELSLDAKGIEVEWILDELKSFFNL